MSRGLVVGTAVLVAGLVWWQLALSWRPCRQRAWRRAMDEDLDHFVGAALRQGRGLHAWGPQAAMWSDHYRDRFDDDDQETDRHHHRRGWFTSATGGVEERSFTHSPAGGGDIHSHRGIITDEEAPCPEPKAEGRQASGGTPGPQAPDPATSGRAGGAR